jgi:molybdate transport system substrate-binding protein
LVARKTDIKILGCLLLAVGPLAAQAEEVSVAVAANFAAPMQKIAALFTKDTGHTATLSMGSTGKFYAQIKNGAPFHVLLSADDETPLRLEKENGTVPNARFTYALGKLVVWSKQAGLVDPQGEVLRNGGFTHLAIADPKLAPYGGAAIETLKALDLLTKLQPRLVQGESIGQAYQFVASGNAQLGFVALSQVMSEHRITEGSAWLVPPHLYPTLRQDAVLLKKGKDNPAALALLAYLKSEKARAVIRSFGFGL